METLELIGPPFVHEIAQNPFDQLVPKPDNVVLR